MITKQPDGKQSGKKSVSSLEWTNTIRMLKNIKFHEAEQNKDFFWMVTGYSHLTSSELLVGCRQKEENWLIWNQSLIFIFYLATAVATVVCHLYFPWGEAFLVKKGLASFPHSLAHHSFIHFPLKRKKIPRVLFKWLLSNLS